MSALKPVRSMNHIAAIVMDKRLGNDMMDSLSCSFLPAGCVASLKIHTECSKPKLGVITLRDNFIQGADGQLNQATLLYGAQDQSDPPCRGNYVTT